MTKKKLETSVIIFCGISIACLVLSGISYENLLPYKPFIAGFIVLAGSAAVTAMKYYRS
jgi:hypothetical protein